MSLMCLPTISLSDTPSDSLKFSLLSQLHSLLLSSSFGSSFKMTSLRSNVISFQCRDCHPTFTAYHPHEPHKYLVEQSMWNMYSMIMNMLYTKPSKHISLLHVSCLWCLTDVWEDTSWASLGKKHKYSAIPGPGTDTADNMDVFPRFQIRVTLCVSVCKRLETAVLAVNWNWTVS